MMLGIAVTVAVVLTLGAMIYAFTRPGKQSPEDAHAARLEEYSARLEAAAKEYATTRSLRRPPRTESSAMADDNPVKPVDSMPDPATLMIAAAVLSEPSSTSSYESPSHDHSSHDHSSSSFDSGSSSYDSGSSDGGSSGSWD